MPYTYLVTFKQTGQLYYGSRTKNGCEESDLWSTYFTSSKVIRSLIKLHGKEAFDYEIRQRFDTREEALAWETKFLNKVHAKSSRQWLNQAANSPDFHIKFHTEETKRKLSEAGKRRRHSPETIDKIKASRKDHKFIEAMRKAGRSGKNLNRDSEYRNKMSAALTGRKLSPEHRARIGDANRHRKSEHSI